MEKHQLSSKIGRLSILAAIMSVIMPSVYAIDDEDKKDLCQDYGGDWEGVACDFETDDEDNADKFTDELQKLDEFEDDKAALEDDLCDDEDAEETNIDICQSATLAFASTDSEEDEDEKEDNQPNTKEEDEQFAKELCESETYKGEWKNGECTNFPGGQSSASIGYGDECESSDFQKKHPYFCKVTD